MDELRRIDLNMLVTLHALLAEKHVTRASVRLHKSQPAVSHALALLRAHFDDPLLIRRNGSMVLTARAQALAQPLQDALGNLNSLLGAPSFEPSTAKGRFRLSLSDYAARIPLPPLTQKIRQEAPGIDLAISQASREMMISQLLDGELDLALGIFPDVPDAIALQDLFSEGFISLADKKVLPAQGGLSLSDWLSRPHVMLALRPDANDEIEQALAARGLKRHIALALPHWSAAVEVLAGTDLILTVASRAVGPMRNHKSLRQFEPPIEIPHSPISRLGTPGKRGMPHIAGCARPSSSALSQADVKQSSQRSITTDSISS